MPATKGRGPAPAQIARRLSDCADRFLGAALHDTATIDPDTAFGAPAGPDLMRLASAQLRVAAPLPTATAPAAEPAWTTERTASVLSSYLSA